MDKIAERQWQSKYTPLDSNIDISQNLPYILLLYYFIHSVKLQTALHKRPS